MLKKVIFVFPFAFFICLSNWVLPVHAITCDYVLFLKFADKGGTTKIWKLKDKKALFFVAGMKIDADGAPNAYDPEKKRGLDFLGNAGRRGNWWALATDNGTPSGKPIVQQDGEFKGFYISQTSLRDHTKKDADISKYVDARFVPYYVLPPMLLGKGKAHLGDLGVVYNTQNDTLSFAIFADVGPKNSIGEGSIALGNRLGIPTELRKKNAGQERGVFYLVFPGTTGKPAWPRSPDWIKNEAENAFLQWGGIAQLRACLTKDFVP